MRSASSASTSTRRRSGFAAAAGAPPLRDFDSSTSVPNSPQPGHCRTSGRTSTRTRGRRRRKRRLWPPSQSTAAVPTRLRDGSVTSRPQRAPELPAASSAHVEVRERPVSRARAGCRSARSARAAASGSAVFVCPGGSRRPHRRRRSRPASSPLSRLPPAWPVLTTTNSWVILPLFVRTNVTFPTRRRLRARQDVELVQRDGDDPSRGQRTCGQRNGVRRPRATRRSCIHFLMFVPPCPRRNVQGWPMISPEQGIARPRRP